MELRGFGRRTEHMTLIRVTVVSIVLVLAGCGSEAQTASPPSTTAVTSVSPPTTGEHGNRIERPRPADLRPIDFDALDAGETVLADWTASCGTDLWAAFDIRYRPDRAIGGDHRIDFPDAWTVYVANEEASDGPSFILLDVELEQVAEDTVQMRSASDGSIVAVFERDASNPNEWERCG